MHSLLAITLLTLSVDEQAMTQKADASYWRDKTISVQGSVTGPARLWLRIVRPSKTVSPFDYLAGETGRIGTWLDREVTLPVPNDAEAIEYGVLAEGDPAKAVRDLSIGAPGARPKNLDFARGLDGWTNESAEATSTNGVILKGPGTLSQTFSAEGWNRRTLRLRASLQFEGSGTATLWIREQAGEEHLWSRPVASGEIARTIAAAAENLTIGFTVEGEGRLTIQQVSVQYAPDSESVPNEPTVAPPPAEQKELINRAGSKAAAWLRSLPDFLCTQTVTRSEKRSRADWALKDVLTLQLGYADHAEHYKLTAVNDQPTTATYREVGGATTQGEFGSILGEIFEPGAAQFTWLRRTLLRGRSVEVFSYKVRLEKSQYSIRYGTKRDKTSEKIVACHGFVFIDRETGETLRLQQSADPPSDFPIRATSTTLDYGFSEVGGQRYLLPLRAFTELGTDRLQIRNESVFHNYRKFGADATFTLDPAFNGSTP